MKGRKLNLENYLVGSFDEEGKEKEIPYDVKGSLISLLFHKELNLSALQLLDMDDLGRRIRDCKDKEIHLEEADYLKIKQAVDSFIGYGERDIELVRRVATAPQVEMEEKKGD